MKLKLILTVLFLNTVIADATIWQVGPTRTYTFCSQVAPLVQNGDTIEIDFSTYVNDPQVQWNKNNLFITGIGGRPRLQAGSIIANDPTNGKGIFVISGSNVHVHNIEFANAIVQDNNGAGIRQEGANLWVSNCKFESNQMGILSGNIPNCKTTVEFSEFANSGSIANPGFQHNIYINHIDTFIFRYNYSHEAIAEGHELKSRANYNFILYNRIANEQSIDSRTIDLPNGGTSVLVGNIIEQGMNSINSNLLGFGLEGLTNPAPHRLYCSSNTFINKKTTGSFIQIASGTDTFFVKNNIFAGAKTGGLFIGTASVLDSSNNRIDNSISNFGFVDATNFNYHLSPTSPAIDAGINIPNIIHGYALQPTLHYKDSSNVEPRPVNNILDIGAYEYVAPVSIAENSLIDFKIYPNPAFNTLHIQLNNAFPMNTTIVLINQLGEEVLRKRLRNRIIEMDVSVLKSGFYYYKLFSNQQMHASGKLILQ